MSLLRRQMSQNRLGKIFDLHNDKKVYNIKRLRRVIFLEILCLKIICWRHEMRI